MITVPESGATEWAVPKSNLCLVGAPPYSFSLRVVDQLEMWTKNVALTYLEGPLTYTFAFEQTAVDNLPNGQIKIGAKNSKVMAILYQDAPETELLVETLKVV